MITQILPEDVKAKLDAGEPILLVDVRQPEEYAHCRLADSVLIPLGELPSRTEEIDAEDQLVVVLCHHGIRSISGAAMLHHAGVTNVASMHGGIDAWSLRVDPSVPRY